MRTREEEQGQNEKDLLQQQQRPKSSKETGWMEMLFVIIRYQDLDLQDGRVFTPQIDQEGWKQFIHSSKSRLERLTCIALAIS